MAIFKAGLLRPVLATVPEEPEPAQQAPLRPRMEPRPAAVKYENRHSLIPVVKELDASLPPSWRPPSPPSQSFFDWSDDEIEPPPKPRRRRKSSKGKDSAEESATDVRERQDVRKPSDTFSDHSAAKHNSDDMPGTLFSKRSSAESNKTSSDQRSSSETTGSAKDSFVRAVKSLKNLRTASKSTSMADLTASDMKAATTLPYDYPPIPPLPGYHTVATSPPATGIDRLRKTSGSSDVEGSATSSVLQERHPTSSSHSATIQRTSSETVPRMLPMMGSFLGAPTVFLTSPSAKHHQDSDMTTSPTVSVLRSPATPSTLPRSASSPGAALNSFGLGRKLRRHFSSQAEDSDASGARGGTVATDLFAPTPQDSSPHGGLVRPPASKKKRRARTQINEALFNDPIIVNSARELTAVLIERGRALGLKPACAISDLNDNEVDYIVQNYRESKKACVQNYLFQSESIADKPQGHSTAESSQPQQPFGLGIDASSTSLCPEDSIDTASIFSTISAGKIDTALGPDYNPHLSTFGLDAVNYLNELRKKNAMDPTESAGSTPTIRASEPSVKAERSAVDPAKIKMTPELQQQLFTASLSRAEQLKRMPEHPYLRDEPVSKMSFDSDGGVQQEDNYTGKRVVSPVETQIEELLTTLELEKQKSDGSASLQTTEGQLSETQQVRQDFGLALLRRPRTGTQKHPKHIFDWHTEKLMCRSIHNPLEILPELPAFDPTREVSMSEFDQHFFDNINSAEYKAPIKCASPVCDQYCCLYGKLYVNSLSYQGDISSYSRALKCMEDANKIKARKPNGIEEWESFLKCTFCSKVYCPACIKLCAQPICQQPFCIFCSDGKADCEDHEGVL